MPVSSQQPPHQPPQQAGWGQPQQPGPQPPPGWGPPQQPPRQPKKSHTGRNIALAAVGVVLVLAVIGSLAGEDSTTQTPSAGGGADTTEARDEPADTNPPETTASGPAAARLGETLQFEDSFGDHVIDVTVARKKVSTGDQFDEPDGVYIGFFIRVKAFKDGISVPGFYALTGGKRYEQTFATGFEPGLDAYEVNKGETAEGWLVYDVPSLGAGNIHDGNPGKPPATGREVSRISGGFGMSRAFGARGSMEAPGAGGAPDRRAGGSLRSVHRSAVPGRRSFRCMV
jgi:hypothetical protein